MSEPKTGHGVPAWRAAIWSAVAVVAISAGGNLSSASRLGVSRARARAGEDIVASLVALRGDLVDAETGQRGYLLVGEEAYLAPFSDARARVTADLATVHQLDSAASLTPVDAARLTRLSLAKLSELDSTVALRRGGSVEPAMAIVRSDRGKFLMDSVRTLVHAIAARQDALTTADREDEALWTRILLIGQLIGVSIVIGVLVYLLRTLAAYESSQRAAQREMELQMRDLEALSRASRANGGAA